jgi:hypothetical protein
VVQKQVPYETCYLVPETVCEGGCETGNCPSGNCSTGAVTSAGGVQLRPEPQMESRATTRPTTPEAEPQAELKPQL